MGVSVFLLPCIILRMCRALSESRLRAKLELSANQSGTLKECKPEAQHAFSERDKVS